MEQVKAQQEIWENATLGMVGILKYDRRGDPSYEVVPGGGKFSLSVDERLLNQDRAAEGLDVFTNGTFTPIRLIENSEGAKEIANNANLMGEQAIRDTLKAPVKTLQAKLSEITNSVTLNRMLAVADEQDASVSKVKAIQARLEEVAPKTYVDHTSPPPSPRPSGFNPVATK